MTSLQNTPTSNVNAGKQNIMAEVSVKSATTENIGDQKIETKSKDITINNMQNIRNPHRIIYGSSYDRGLSHLLEIWSQIKKEVPDAQLHIFYGWDLFDKGYAGNPERMDWKDRMNKLMEQKGITHLGRIGHAELQKEFDTAGVWAYPCHFGEISCITAMRAQIGGAIPVVVNYAALKETVHYGVKVEGDIYEPEVKEDFKNQLVALLKDEKKQEEIRKEMMPWAQKEFGWSKVALQWDAEFKAEKSLDRQVEELMEDNQPLKAYELVKMTDSPLKEKVYAKVKHAFDPREYKKFYSKDLPESPLQEEYVLQADRIYPRWKWAIDKIVASGAKEVLDMGCADGVFALTLASKGIKTKGINLYQPSVDLANKRAVEYKVPATFVCKDFFKHGGSYDAIVMLEVLEHLPDPKKGINHAMSMLNEGGTFYLSTPSPDHLGITLHKQEKDKKGWADGKPSGHLRIFTEAELREMLKEYKIKEIQVDAEKCFLVEVQK